MNPNIFARHLITKLVQLYQKVFREGTKKETSKDG